MRNSAGYWFSACSGRSCDDPNTHTLVKYTQAQTSCLHVITIAVTQSNTYLQTGTAGSNSQANNDISLQHVHTHSLTTAFGRRKKHSTVHPAQTHSLFISPVSSSPQDNPCLSHSKYKHASLRPTYICYNIFTQVVLPNSKQLQARSRRCSV